MTKFKFLVFRECKCGNRVMATVSSFGPDNIEVHEDKSNCFQCKGEQFEYKFILQD